MRRIWPAAALILLSAFAPTAQADIYPSDKAQISGRQLEKVIEAGFQAHGVEVIANADWNEARAYREPNLTAVIKNAPYVSIYGHRAKIEFLLLHGGQQFLIEVKRQRTSGSTDEKLPYVVANAKANIARGREFILIVEGDGWKPGALSWVRQQADEITGFSVLSPQEFFSWMEALSPSEAVVSPDEDTPTRPEIP